MTTVDRLARELLEQIQDLNLNPPAPGSRPDAVSQAQAGLRCAP